MMQALASLPAAEARPVLAIAGGRGPEGEYEAQLRNLASSLGLADSVRFLGPVEAETVAEIMSAADVFCLASTNEGWPNVVHEAVWWNMVVATDVGAVPDMLAGGRYGVIVPINDSPALQRALEEALRQRWDRQAIAHWGQARGWRQVACEVLEQMQAVIRESQEFGPCTAG